MAFKSSGLPDDALTIAIVETGVALRAFDADRLSGSLCIRDSAPGEALPGQAGELAQGTLTIADEKSPVGLLFGPTGDGYGVEPESRRLTIVAVQVNGVPQIAVSEALWMAAATVEASPALAQGLNRFPTCHRAGVIYTQVEADAGSARKRQPQRRSTSMSTSASPGRAAAPGRPSRARARRALRRGLRPGRAGPPGRGVTAEPRVLDLGELERLRDELAERVADARVTLRERARVETANRELLRRMLASPADFKWVIVTRDDLGLPGCGHWHSRPRLGPIGMLMGWWRVKVSSGCPLAGRLTAVEQEAQGKATETGGAG